MGLFDFPKWIWNVSIGKIINLFRKPEEELYYPYNCAIAGLTQSARIEGVNDEFNKRI